MYRQIQRVERSKWLTCALLVVVTVGLGTGAGNAAQTCQIAARQAAQETGVPVDVLLAISAAETGRKQAGILQPWPWAMNTGGQSHWFDTADDLYLAADAALRDGQTNVDLGCFQLNYRWHAAGFASLEQMIDPAANAVYAAGFLKKLYAESGDWASAAAAYHSRTPEYAAAYRAKFEAILAGLDPSSAAMDVADISDLTDPRINRFPLLQAGTRGVAGSLVPLGDGGPRLIGGS